MTERTTFQRKIIYLVIMAVPAILMHRLGTPATSRSAGGHLAVLRDKHKLQQANLGEVDPASETMRFLTLGLRGVAVTVLWEKANEYKKTEDWTNLTATLEQLAKLQPNFITFWKYQAWNLTYNVSVEFDDYRDRYYYVRRGIEFLQEGEQYNANNRQLPQLLSDLGWFIGHKIGRADEKVLYRRLFKEDDDFHPPDRPFDERDNWLVSKGWYLKAIQAVDFGPYSIGKKNPREFYSDPAKSQINYAEAIEEEGFFEKARRAWVLAGQEWRDFGRRPILHTFGDLLLLGEEHRLVDKVTKLRDELQDLAPGTRENLVNERRQSLTADELKLLDTPREQVSVEDSYRYYALEAKTEVLDRDVADRISRDHPDKAGQALLVMRQLEDTDRVLRYTRNYKETSNFDFWKMRCDYEQTADAVAARQYIFRANQEAQAANRDLAKELYHNGFLKWLAVLDEFPELIDEDVVFGYQIIEDTKKYRDVLEQFGESLNESYPLWNALEKFDSQHEFTEEIAKHRERKAAAEATAK
jgi:hypothetical protein